MFRLLQISSNYKAKKLINVFSVPRAPKIDKSNIKDIFVKKGENIELDIPFDGKVFVF